MTGSEDASDLKVRYEHVLDAAKRISGDSTEATRWCEQQPIHCLDGKTARELVAANRGADVLRYLRSLEADAAG